MKTIQTPAEIAFIVTLTADATHELNNILAIIRESAGLVQDLMNAAELVRPERKATAQNCLDTIEQRIEKGIQLLKDLNRLAHDPDQTIARIDVVETVRRLIRLCQRSAGQKQTRLVLKNTTANPTLTCNPLLFQTALYTSLQICQQSLDGPGEITLGIAEETERIVVSMFPACDCSAINPVSLPADDNPFRDRLSSLLTQISGEFNRPGGDGLIRMSFPSTSDHSHT